MEFSPQDVKGFIGEQQLGLTDEFGQTFKGQIPPHNRYGIEPAEVYIKVFHIRSRHTAKADLDLHFRNELKLCGFHHKNIVHLIGFSETPDHFYLIYEMINGKPLTEVISGLMWENVLNILIGVASGLNYLHTHPEGTLVHSNISSSSILVSMDGMPKLVDFRHCLEEGKQRTGGPSGYYHTLEEKGEATKECDTFAFGVVALQMVTKDSRIGFLERGLDGSCECRHIIQQYVPVFKESGNIVNAEYGQVGNEGRKVSELIIKCLGKDTKPSMEDVLKDLRLLRLSRKLVGSPKSPFSALKRQK